MSTVPETSSTGAGTAVAGGGGTPLPPPLASYYAAGIWLTDFEFIAEPGERPDPVCLVARDLVSGRLVRQWRDDMGSVPPYSIGPDALFVCFFAPAELSCHLSLGWPMPARVLDLFTEFRCATNGLSTVAGNSLLGALAHYGLDGIGGSEKDGMRQLIMSGGPWTAAERVAILDYCQSDVDALARLLPAMAPRLDLPRALLRGRYQCAVSHMEHVGVPIDTAALAGLRTHWHTIQDALIADVDADYSVFDGRSFRQSRFEDWLRRTGTAWPRLPSGALDLSRDAFRERAKADPAVAPLAELRTTLSEMRLNSLRVGADGRNRAMLSPFRARTGRNQPSNSRFIFGPSAWLRSLIQPAPGRFVAYCDWSQQEFGIAAALSGDALMLEAYASGDPYLTFAKQAGAVPEDATKQSHKTERDLFKACTLAVQYGMEAESLASRIGQPTAKAKQLLRLHRETYRRFWQWSDNLLDYAMTHNRLWTVFGWTIHVGADANPRSLRNFPMQANGAEMLRLACCLMTERGLNVCAPVHDAVLIEGSADAVDETVDTAKRCMAEASRVILDGFTLAVDADVIIHPDRYSDPRGATMWSRVRDLVAEAEREAGG